jgi:hypothetical protein
MSRAFPLCSCAEVPSRSAELGPDAEAPCRHDASSDLPARSPASRPTLIVDEQRDEDPRAATCAGATSPAVARAVVEVAQTDGAAETTGHALAKDRAPTSALALARFSRRLAVEHVNKTSVSSSVSGARAHARNCGRREDSEADPERLEALVHFDNQPGSGGRAYPSHAVPRNASLAISDTRAGQAGLSASPRHSCFSRSPALAQPRLRPARWPAARMCRRSRCYRRAI